LNHHAKDQKFRNDDNELGERMRSRRRRRRRSRSRRGLSIEFLNWRSSYWKYELLLLMRR
jgi:hypothetical protein